MVAGHWLDGAVPEVGPEAFEAAGVDDGVVGVGEKGADTQGDDGPGVEGGGVVTGELGERVDHIFWPQSR